MDKNSYKSMKKINSLNSKIKKVEKEIIELEEEIKKNDLELEQNPTKHDENFFEEYQLKKNKLADTIFKLGRITETTRNSRKKIKLEYPKD